MLWKVENRSSSLKGPTGVVLLKEVPIETTLIVFIEDRVVNVEKRMNVLKLGGDLLQVHESTPLHLLDIRLPHRYDLC